MTPRLFNLLLFGLALAILAVLATCKRSPDPAPAPASAPLVCNISGLGGSQTDSQLDDILVMEHTFSGMQTAIWNNNGWMSPVADYCRKSKYDRLIFVAHSFGGQAACDEAAKLPAVDLLILIDPVCHDWGKSTITVPSSVKACVVFRRASEGWGVIGIERRATVMGKAMIVDVGGGHNQIPHDPAVIAEIHDLIGGVL